MKSKNQSFELKLAMPDFDPMRPIYCTLFYIGPYGPALPPFLVSSEGDTGQTKVSR